jgi:hypothetical protein
MDERPQEQDQPPDVVCSGGFQLPKLSAFVPSLDQLAELARKGQPDGE